MVKNNTNHFTSIISYFPLSPSFLLSPPRYPSALCLLPLHMIINNFLSRSQFIPILQKKNQRVKATSPELHS